MQLTKIKLIAIALWLVPTFALASAGFSMLPTDRPTRFNATAGAGVFANSVCTAIDGGDCSIVIATMDGITPFAAPDIGDVLLFVCACSSTSAAQDCAPTSVTGATELTDQTNGATNMRLSTSYVVLTGTNMGESITCNGSGGAADATVGAAMSFRPPDATQPDATTTIASGNSTNPNPGPITSATDVVRIVISCASANNDSAIVGASKL